MLGLGVQRMQVDMVPNERNSRPGVRRVNPSVEAVDGVLRTGPAQFARDGATVFRAGVWVFQGAEGEGALRVEAFATFIGGLRSHSANRARSSETTRTYAAAVVSDTTVF